MNEVPNVTKINSLGVASEPHLIHLSENYKFQQSFFSILNRHHLKTVNCLRHHLLRN